MALTLNRLFQFQIINVFLVTTVAGSVFDVVNKIANHPSDTFTLLGETLPKVTANYQ
jgi:calcium permeable stress-gated cation channel